MTGRAHLRAEPLARLALACIAWASATLPVAASLPLAASARFTGAGPTAPRGVLQDDAPPAPDETAPRRSLEELLKEAREQRAKAQEALLPRLTPLIAELEGLDRKDRDGRAKEIVRSIVALGPDVGPLLIQYLDPGETGSRAQVFRSETVARAIGRLRTPSVTDALLERAHSASLVGRLNAIEALTSAPDGDRVAPVLEKLARLPADPAAADAVPQAVRVAAMRALARMGGPAAKEIISATLLGSDLVAAEAALDAVIEARLAASAPDVLAVAKSPRGSALASRIAAYLAAVPEAMAQEDAVETAIELAARDVVGREAKLALLDMLRRGDHKAPSSMKRELKALRDTLDQAVKRATLTYLARQKDRSARNELLGPWDDAVKQDRTGSGALEGRAQLLYEIGDYSAAIKDWRDALKIQSERAGTRSVDPYVGLARCFALTGRFKDAADYLKQAPLSLSALHALALDPDFAAMLESKYGEVFLLPEDAAGSSPDAGGR